MSPSLHLLLNALLNVFLLPTIALMYYLAMRWVGIRSNTPYRRPNARP